MANEATAPDETAEQRSSGGVVKTMLTGVAIFVIVLVAQAVAPLITSKLGLTPPVMVQAVSAPMADGAADGALDGPPLYWPLKPAMVVNFSSGGEAGFLQVEMEVMARHQAVIDLVKDHAPALRNSLLMLLASQTEETVFSTAGKQALREQALNAINEVLAPYLDDQRVEEVYFTSFVAQ